MTSLVEDILAAMRNNEVPATEHARNIAVILARGSDSRGFNPHEANYVISEYWRHVSEIAAEMEKLQSVDIDPIRNTDCPLCDPKPGDIKQEIAKTGHAEHRARYPDSKIPECLMCQHNHFGHGVSGSDEVPR